MSIKGLQNVSLKCLILICKLHTDYSSELYNISHHFNLSDHIFEGAWALSVFKNCQRKLLKRIERAVDLNKYIKKKEDLTCFAPHRRIESFSLRLTLDLTVKEITTTLLENRNKCDRLENKTREKKFTLINLIFDSFCIPRDIEIILGGALWWYHWYLSNNVCRCLKQKKIIYVIS